MRRALTWIAGLAGILALVRRRVRPRAPALSDSRPPDLAPRDATEESDPAVELRQKLEETRAADPERDAPDEEAAPLDEPLSLDERRARAHERAQDAINQMRAPDDDPGGDDPTPGAGAA